MKQDKDIEKIIIATGQRVKTTGQMLYTGWDSWAFEIIYKNGIKEWRFATELKDISNSE